jgi:hypothetical protein
MELKFSARRPKNNSAPWTDAPYLKNEFASKRNQRGFETREFAGEYLPFFRAACLFAAINETTVGESPRDAIPSHHRP